MHRRRHPHTVATAIRRDDLPSGQLSVWVQPDDPPPGVVDGPTDVAAGELTASGISETAAVPLDGEGAMARAWMDVVNLTRPPRSLFAPALAWHVMRGRP